MFRGMLLFNLLTYELSTLQQPHTTKTHHNHTPHHNHNHNHNHNNKHNHNHNHNNHNFNNKNTTTTTTKFKQVCVALVSFLSVEPMWSARNAEDAGTAKRRRERPSRQFLRHERLTVAMLLAETQHHAAPRVQNMATSRREESELNNAMGQKTPPPRVASTLFFTLDDDGDVLAALSTHLP